MPNDEFTLPEAEVEVANITEAPNTAEGVDPLYERQASLGLSRPSVFLVGAGGVGCWVALSLVLGGVDRLTIFDGDTISLHNLNRFPLSESSVGELKSMELAKWLRTLRPKADNISARGMFDPDTDPNLANISPTWMVCCTDSLKSRKLCHKFAIDNGMNYLEVGADGERWTLSPQPPEFSTELEDNPGYQTVPVHVGPCMMAGAAVSYYVLHNTVPTVSHLIDWDKGPVYNNSPRIYGSLSIASIDESKPYQSGYPMIPCPKCHSLVEGNLINLIKHLREEFNLGLVEAKAMAESLIAKAEPVPLNPEEDNFDAEIRAHIETENDEAYQAEGREDEQV